MKWWDQMPWSSFSECWALSQLFLSPLSLSSRGLRSRDLFKKIRDTKGTFHAKMGLIKDRNGRDLTEAEDIKKRWQEYRSGLPCPPPDYISDPGIEPASLSPALTGGFFIPSSTWGAWKAVWHWHKNRPMAQIECRAQKQPTQLQSISGNSVRLYFWGLQNHCRWWLQPWN